MNNFKSGSGNLDFGADDDDDDVNESKPETTLAESASEDAEVERESKPTPETETTPTPNSSGGSRLEQSTNDLSSTNTTEHNYPYFVRRSNVGDERDKRLEIHVREEVSEEEGKFRNQLAEILETNEVSKTDAREFALLAAFQHPEQVAELMQEEGFGAVN
jgi:hypothetical protein